MELSSCLPESIQLETRVLGQFCSPAQPVSPFPGTVTVVSTGLLLQWIYTGWSFQNTKHPSAAGLGATL